MGKEKQRRVPLLMTSHGEKQYFYNLLNVDGSAYQTTSLPVLCNKTVVGSSYGWLALLDRNQGDCCLWNPTSMEIIQLPIFDNPCRFNRCFFSKPPTHPDCFVVFNQFCSMDQVVYYMVGDGTFSKLNLGREILADMVSFQGKIYGIVRHSHVFATYEFVSMRMDNDEDDVLGIDEKLFTFNTPAPSWITSTNNYLIESPCGNELLLVTKMMFVSSLNSCVHFRVFRLDLARKEFQELFDLEGRTVFISYYGNGFCSSSESNDHHIKPNSIYYTNRTGMVVDVYNLEERSTITLQLYTNLAETRKIDVKLQPNHTVDDDDDDDEEDDDIDPASFWVDLPPNILTSSGFV